MGNRINDFKKAIALEEVEQVPVIPTVGSWVGRFSGIPLTSLLYDARAMVKAQIEAQEVLGHDALFAYIDSLYIPEAFGCPLRFLSSGGVDVLPLDLKTEEEARALRIPDIRKDGRLPVILSVAEQLLRTSGREVPVLSLIEGPFTTCARILGTERMMRALMKNKPLVKAVLERIEALLLQFGQALGKLGIDGLIIADPVGSATMVSPKMYREMVLPDLRSFIKSLEIPVILHVCGDTSPILDMMVETGAKVLSLDQCMDLSFAKERIARRSGIGGNVDPVNVLLLGTVEEVRRETLRCLKQGGTQGYLLMAGCGVPPGTPTQNLKAMVETARSFSPRR